MGALGSAISGLQSSQKWLDVISNNVSNSQTLAYKSSRLSFSDLISTGLRSASGYSSSSNLGGVNPSQLGLGVTVQTVQTMMNQGSTQVTGNVTDLAIQGSGFFTVNKGSQTLYTRAGNLTFDNFGNLVTQDGGLVQGWSLKTNRTVTGSFPLTTPPSATVTISAATLDTSNTAAIGNIVIPNNLVLGPSATSVQLSEAIKSQGVIINGNLDNNTPLNAFANFSSGTVGAAGTTFYGAAATPNAAVPDATVTFIVHDSLGTAYTMLLSFYQTANTPSAPAAWGWVLNDITGGATPNGDPWTPGGPGNLVAGSGQNTAAGQAPYGSATVGAGVGPASGSILFNQDGSLAQSNTDPVTGLPLDQNVSVGIRPINGAVNPFNFSLNFGTENVWAIVPPAITPSLVTMGGRDGLTGDYGDGTYNSSGVYQPVQNVYSSFVDGYAEGTLNGLSFDQTGGVNASFSNGQILTVAKLAMTTFSNAGGLSRIGGNYYEASAASGASQIRTAGASGVGSITGGALEESNVDLSVELTNMILAQRMFESNARVVTAADKVLETLVNLGR